MTDREVVSLKEYFEVKLRDLESKLQVRFDLADKAVTITANALQAKLDEMNQFRSQILEERQLYARKDEMELRLTAILEKVNSIAEKLTFSGGRTSGKEYAIGIFIAIGIALAGFIINLVKG